MSKLLESFKRKDKYGQEIMPGDVCVWGGRKGAVICVYIGDTRGHCASGRYGRFITDSGKRSLSYGTIVFAYDPMGKRKNNSETIKRLLREYYG